VKTGRSDPCICGSGKKYKHCCLDAENSARRIESGTFTEPVVPPFLMQQAVSGFLDEGRRIVNVGPGPEPVGFEDMLQELLEKGPFRAKNAVTINTRIDAHAVVETPVIKYMEVFLEVMVRNKGLSTLDGMGNPTLNIDDFLSIMREQTAYDCLNIGSTGEPLFPIHLLFAHVCLRELKFIETNEKGSEISERGLDFLAGKGRKQVYFRALKKMTDKVNWFYLSELPEEVETFHEVRGIALLVASRIREVDPLRIRPKDLLDSVDATVPVYEELKTAGINRKRAVGIFTDYFLLLYCYFFDFMRVSEADTRGRPVSFSKTELLHDVFRWHI
jgi:hypothetical protein